MGPPDDRGRARDPRPTRLQYAPGEVIPPGYKAEQRPHIGMLVSGLITFGVPWLFSATVGYIDVVGEDQTLAPLLVPVVGPLITIGTADTEGAGTYFLVLDTIVQTVGASLFVASLLTDEHYLRRVGSTDVTLDVAVGASGAALRLGF